MACSDMLGWVYRIVCEEVCETAFGTGLSGGRINFGESGATDIRSCPHHRLFSGALDGPQLGDYGGKRFSSRAVECFHDGIIFGPRFRHRGQVF